MKTLLKVGLVLGAVAVGTAVVLKKYAPDVYEDAKAKIKGLNPLKEKAVEVEPVSVLDEVVEDITEAVEDGYDAVTEAGEEVCEAVADAVEQIEVVEEAEEEWPDLSQLPE